MGGDRLVTASDFDSYPPVPPVVVKSSYWKPVLMMITVILASLALFLSSLAVQRNRQQDRDAAISERDRINAQLVAGCEQFNLSREIQYNSTKALAAIAIANSQRPDVIPPAVQALLDYNEQANEPVSCDLTDPNFGKDTTPPSIPPLPGVTTQ